MNVKILALAASSCRSRRPRFAHHSFAMFDREKANMSGVVKEYEWTNPHVWIHVMAAGRARHAARMVFRNAVRPAGCARQAGGPIA